MDENIKFVLDKTETNLSNIENGINSNYGIHILLISFTILHTYFPNFDQSIYEYFKIDIKVLEFAIPYYFFYLLLKYGFLLVWYLQQRQIQIKAIKKLNVQENYLNRLVLDKLYRKQVLFEYWFRLLFLKEYRFNKLSLLVFTLFNGLIIALNHAFSIIYIWNLGFKNVRYGLIVLYVFLILTFYYLFIRAMNFNNKIKYFIFLVLLLTITILFINYK